MRFLIDTNVVISSEPVATGDVERATRLSLDLARLASGGHQLLVHPTLPDEIGHDRDEHRRQVRLELIRRYPTLDHPPAPQPALEDELGVPTVGSHDWYDHQLLAAVAGNAVHGLITQDDGIHRKARRLGLSSSVYTLADAVALLDALALKPADFIPSVDHRFMYEVDLTDPFFDSLRADYDFDQWFSSKAREGRKAFVIDGPEGEIAGLCIVKEDDDEPQLGGRITKVCTFKVGEEFKGSRYGELLLKAMLNHVHGRCDALWVTAYPRQVELIAMLEAFGFRDHGYQATGERRMVKTLTPGHLGEPALGPLAHHVAYGPPALLIEPDQTFVIPIQPHFHSSLFPEAPGEQFTLLAPPPHGNALRKAYLCHANVRQMRPGATLLFYRSGDRRAVTTIGVLEDSLVSQDQDAILTLVGTRTVYSATQVSEMSAKNQVLALLFRQDRFLDQPITLSELKHERALTAAPQTINRINQEAIPWLISRLGA